MTRCRGFAVAVTLAATVGVARADDQITSTSDNRIASTGFYAEAGLGAVAFLYSASRYTDVGPAVDIAIGRDLFSWLSIGGYVAASIHEATVPPPPVDQYFQLYRGGVDLRLQGRLNRIAGFIEGGVGGSLLSTNILEQVMITQPNKLYSLTISGGAGLEYQSLNRHYALGLAVDGFYEPEWAKMKAIESRIYLRYTYGG
jgi:hypothetical protein